MKVFRNTLIGLCISASLGQIAQAQMLNLDAIDDISVAETPITSGDGLTRFQRGRSSQPDADQRHINTQRLLPLIPTGFYSGSNVVLSGDAAQETFGLYLPKGVKATDLLVTHRNGIDILPEQSELQININGVDIGVISPDNFGDFTTDRLEIPNAVLTAGMNQVTITAQHFHRIACGTQAAYDLWSEIDISLSGINVGYEDLDLSWDGFVAAAAAVSALNQPVPVRGPENADLDGQLKPFFEVLSQKLGASAMRAKQSGYWVPQSAQPELLRISVVPGTMTNAPPTFLRGGDGAIVLQLTESQGLDKAAKILNAQFPEIEQASQHVACPSSDKMGHETGLSFGGSGSSVELIMQLVFDVASGVFGLSFF